MATFTDVYNAVYDECVTALERNPIDGADASVVDDGTAHVVYEDADLPENPPAVSLRVSDRPNEPSVGEAKVVEEITDDSGDVVDYVYAKEQDAQFTATVMAPSQSTVADVYTRLKLLFSGYESIIEASELQSDIGGVSVEDGLPSGRSTSNGMVLDITVEYTVRFSYSDLTGSQFTPARSVDLTLEGETETVN